MIHARYIASLLLTVGSMSLAQGANTSANDLVRTVINNELKTEAADHSHWMLRLDTKKPNSAEEVDEVVETKGGELRRPILINGRKVSDDEQRKADAHIRYLVQHPNALRKLQHDQMEDQNRSQHMLKLLPDAFVFQYGEHRGDLMQLNFKPNPKFRPPDREARVFHAMEGSIWLNTKQNRLAQIDGQLTQEVKFGAGFLGHLDKGGQFHVKQEEVAPGYWELTSLNVQMNGKVLFFKTIAVRQKYTRSDFKRVSDSLTIAQGAQMLHNAKASQQAELH